MCVPTEDTLNFWKGIADVGLLGEVVTNISSELLALLNGVHQRSEPGTLQDTGTQLHLDSVSTKLYSWYGQNTCPTSALNSNCFQIALV